MHEEVEVEMGGGGGGKEGESKTEQHRAPRYLPVQCFSPNVYFGSDWQPNGCN